MKRGTFSQQSLTRYYVVAGITVAVWDSSGTLIPQQRSMPLGEVR